MRRVAWDGCRCRRGRKRGKEREEVEWWRGVGRKCLFLRVFLRAAADLLPLACLDFTQHLRPFKARTRASGGHRYAPRRVFLAPKYTGTATTTLHRLRRHFPNPESDAPERRCPFWADEKEGEVEKAPGAGAPGAPLPPLLFFNSFYLFNLAIPSHHSTAQGTPSHLTLPRSHFPSQLKQYQE